MAYQQRRSSHDAGGDGESLKDLIADVNVNEICEHIETETLSEWVNAWQEAALSALRPVSRERVEKVWRGEWEQCFEDWRKQIEGDKCSRCGFEHYGTSIKKHHFCPSCGSPMTGEAVEMVMERLEAIFSARNDD